MPARRGPDSPFWKGDEASYQTIHEWLRTYHPHTGQCEHCGQSKRTDYATKVQDVYTRNRDDYLELCRKCHSDFDGVSDETKAKMSAVRKGKAKSPEHRAAISAAAKARCATPEGRAHQLAMSKAGAKARHAQTPGTL